MNLEEERTAELEWFYKHYGVSPGDKIIKLPFEILIKYSDFILFDFVLGIFRATEELIIVKFDNELYCCTLNLLRDYRIDELIEYELCSVLINQLLVKQLGKI